MRPPDGLLRPIIFFDVSVPGNRIFFPASKGKCRASERFAAGGVEFATQQQKKAPHERTRILTVLVAGRSGLAAIALLQRAVVGALLMTDFKKIPSKDKTLDHT